MSLPRYTAYKDSDIPWLGQVPAHWACVRLASLFREIAEPGNDDLPILSVSIHDGVSDKELSEEEADRKVTRSDDRSKYKAVAPDDLTYNMMRAWQGGFGTVAVAGMVSPAYVVARPTAKFVTSHIELLLRTPQAGTEMKPTLVASRISVSDFIGRTSSPSALPCRPMPSSWPSPAFLAKKPPRLMR